MRHIIPIHAIINERIIEIFMPILLARYPDNAYAVASLRLEVMPLM